MTSQRRRLIALSMAYALGLSLPAMAQQPQQQQQKMDPRLSDSMVEVLQAQIKLRDAALRAVQEDQMKREGELAEWFKGWFAEPKATGIAPEPEAPAVIKGK